MSHIEVFRRVAAAFQRADMAALAPDLHTDFVFVPRRAPIQGDYHGAAGMREFFRDNEENFDVFEPVLDTLEELGDRVLALGRLRVRGKGSGADTVVPIALIASFQDGKVVRVQDYAEEQRAREAL